MIRKLLYIYLGSVSFTFFMTLTRLLPSEIISSLAGYGLFFIFTLLMLTRAPEITPWKVLVAILLGWSSIEVTPRFFMGENWNASYVDSICRILGIAAAYGYYKIGRPVLKTLVAVGITLLTCTIVYLLILK